MSAKDPRRSILLRVPQALRPVLRCLRAQQRRPSTAAALRLLVIRGLDLPDDTGRAPRALSQPVTGRVLRLQLDNATLRRVTKMAQAQHLSLASAVLSLAARAAAFERPATMPQDRSRRAPVPSSQ